MRGRDVHPLMRGRARQGMPADPYARRAEIVRAAIDLLAETGFEGLSLRRLASHLRMHAPGLYWYVESKEELVDLMAKEIIEDGMAGLKPLAPPQTWDEWLVDMACMTRRALLARRDGARVVAGAFLLRSEAITPTVELAIEVLENAGFPRLVALGNTMTLLRYATGIALTEQLSPFGGPPNAEQTERIAKMNPPLIDPVRFPRTADAYAQVFAGQHRDSERMFRWGAEMIVRGYRELLEGELGR